MKEMKELNEPRNTDVFPNVVSLRRNVNLEYVFTTTCALSLRGFVVASVAATFLYLIIASIKSPALCFMLSPFLREIIEFIPIIDFHGNKNIWL